MWCAHRTTHFVGYLFWSYAHLALAREIECGSSKVGEQKEKKKNKKSRNKNKKNPKKGKRKRFHKRILEQNWIGIEKYAKIKRQPQRSKTNKAKSQNGRLGPDRVSELGLNRSGSGTFVQRIIGQGSGAAKNLEPSTELSNRKSSYVQQHFNDNLLYWSSLDLGSGAGQQLGPQVKRQLQRSVMCVCANMCVCERVCVNVYVCECVWQCVLVCLYPGSEQLSRASTVYLNLKRTFFALKSML